MACFFEVGSLHLASSLFNFLPSLKIDALLPTSHCMFPSSVASMHKCCLLHAALKLLPFP